MESTASGSLLPKCQWKIAGSAALPATLSVLLINNADAYKLTGIIDKKLYVHLCVLLIKIRVLLLFLLSFAFLSFLYDFPCFLKYHWQFSHVESPASVACVPKFFHLNFFCEMIFIILVIAS